MNELLLHLLLSEDLQTELAAHGFAELVLVPLLPYDFRVLFLQLALASPVALVKAELGVHQPLELVRVAVNRGVRLRFLCLLAVGSGSQGGSREVLGVLMEVIMLLLVVDSAGVQEVEELKDVKRLVEGVVVVEAFKGSGGGEAEAVAVGKEDVLVEPAESALGLVLAHHGAREFLLEGGVGDEGEAFLEGVVHGVEQVAKDGGELGVLKEDVVYLVDVVMGHIMALSLILHLSLLI